jgi:diguanylate cyclase (GGDEF)-like protein
MRDFAQKDSLTKFLSRRAWFEFAEQYEVIAKRQKRPFTLLMLDLDNFKKINDQFGHLAGDKILKEFAVITHRVARDSDIIGRFGGEEFIFLLPNTDAEQAYSLCERLHNQIRNTVVDYKAQKLTFTTSIGIACQTESHEHSLDHLISLADNALYTAKSRGKNCSFLYRETYLSNAASYA